ncbi:MAG: DUF6261 family protein [Fibrobacter sp.]|nr:DUF6261 family protein [Fibrobacter sp.]
MKNMTIINFPSLRNDEFLGLHTEGVKYAKAVTDTEIQQAATDYETAVQNLGDFLKASITETAASLAKNLDEERNKIYVACRNVAKAAARIPDASAAETGALICKIFSESPSPLNNNQVQSTGIILNIIQGIKDIEAEKLEACGFKEWLERLESVNNKFVEADMARFSESGSRELEHCKKLRAACVEAYNVMVGAATFKAAAGSESCKVFLESMDAAVVAKKQQVKIRRERKNNEQGENGKPANNATDNAAVNTENAADNAAPTTDNASTVGVENAA